MDNEGWIRVEKKKSLKDGRMDESENGDRSVWNGGWKNKRKDEIGRKKQKSLAEAAKRKGQMEEKGKMGEKLEGGTAAIHLKWVKISRNQVHLVLKKAVTENSKSNLLLTMEEPLWDSLPGLRPQRISTRMD